MLVRRGDNHAVRLGTIFASYARLGSTHCRPRNGARDMADRERIQSLCDCVLRACRVDRYVTEIVCTQMTKTDVFTARLCREDIANLDVVIRDHDPVDEQ